MVATFIPLCNSACITCIWCFLLSICFPKFVKIMEETESSDYWPQRVKSHRDPFEDVRAHEIKRQNGERREIEFDKRRDCRREDEKSEKEGRQFIKLFNRRSNDVHLDRSSLSQCPRNRESLDSVKIDNHNRDIDSEGHKMFANRVNRSRRCYAANPTRNRCRVYGKLSRLSSGLEECFLERKKRTAMEFYCDRTSKCRGCGNFSSRL